MSCFHDFDGHCLASFVGPGCPTSWLLPSVCYVHHGPHVVPGRDAHGAPGAHGVHGAHGVRGAQHLATAPLDITRSKSFRPSKPSAPSWHIPIAHQDTMHYTMAAMARIRMSRVTRVTRVADEVVKAEGSPGRCELKHPPRRCFSWRSSVTWFKGSTRNQGSSQI